LLKEGASTALSPLAEVIFTNFLREIIPFFMPNLPGKWWANLRFQRADKTGWGRCADFSPAPQLRKLSNTRQWRCQMDLSAVDLSADADHFFFCGLAEGKG
jgi:hypothetical protein